MTPKEKANKLFLKYHNLWINGNSIMGKKCALIAVDEILYVCGNEISNCSDKTFFYWQEVKQEIELL